MRCFLVHWVFFFLAGGGGVLVFLRKKYTNMAAKLHTKKKLLMLTTHPFILSFYSWDVIIFTALLNLLCKISFAENFLERLSLEHQAIFVSLKS